MAKKEVSETVLNFSKKLRALRLGDNFSKKKYTQKSIATALGLLRDTYSRYETGTTPPLDILVKICEQFNVSCDYLVGLIDTHQHPEPQPIVIREVPLSLSSGVGYNSNGSFDDDGYFQIKDDEIAFIEAYRKLPEDIKQVVNNLTKREY